MPRKRKPERTYIVESDRDLVGTWWRCMTHGLTQDPIILGGKSYCPCEDCTETVILVHSVLQDRAKNRRGWNAAV